MSTTPCNRWRATWTMPALFAAILLSPLAWPAATANAHKKPGLHGCWHEVLTRKDKRKRVAPEYLTLNKKRSIFRWRKKGHGRFMSRTGKVWLLDAKGSMGELWRYRFTDAGRTLVFHKPETFRYLGRGRYLYFRFRSPRTTRRFRRLGPPQRCPKPTRRSP